MPDWVLGCIAFGIHAIALVAGIFAFVGSFKGRYSRSLFACAYLSVCYVSLIYVGSGFDFYSDHDDFAIDLLIYIPFATIIGFAGLASLIRLRRNKLKFSN